MPPRPVRGGGHGSSRRRHNEAHEEHQEGSERWLVTYADVLTLLLVLFIVLFSISVVNTSKFISLKTSLASVFGNGIKGVMDGGNGLLENDAEGSGQQLVNPGMPVQPVPGKVSNQDPVTGQQVTDIASGQSRSTTARAQQAGGTAYTEAQLTSELDKFKAIEKAIQAALRQHGRAGQVRFKITERGLVITVITNALVFPGNSATLLPDGQDLLAVVGAPLVKQQNRIEVDGFTNQEKVSTYPYPSGWELSSARASAVVRYLATRGVAQSRLSAVGFSDQRPLYPASDPRSVTLNRRVEVVVLSTLPSSAGPELQAAAN
jgi:chemotaxis protein MotB